jgi:hypothetical protein
MPATPSVPFGALLADTLVRGRPERRTAYTIVAVARPEGISRRVTCLRCGASFGELTLSPTALDSPELETDTFYVSHEAGDCHRVLGDDAPLVPSLMALVRGILPTIADNVFVAMDRMARDTGPADWLLLASNTGLQVIDISAAATAATHRHSHPLLDAHVHQLADTRAAIGPIALAMWSADAPDIRPGARRWHCASPTHIAPFDTLHHESRAVEFGPPFTPYRTDTGEIFLLNPYRLRIAIMLIPILESPSELPSGFPVLQTPG